MTADPELLSKKIFSISNDLEFEETALSIFRYQATNCSIYRQFIKGLNIDPEEVQHVRDIPFLPISFFKTHRVIIDGREPEITFTSSGTTGSSTSFHYVVEQKLYVNSFLNAFRLFYGEPENSCILALLPGYLERSGSSLIYMMNELISRSKMKNSGFYLYEHDRLETILRKQEAANSPTILVGVSFALLDFFENRKLPLKNTLIIETGGMKGRRKEIIREELHKELTDATGLKDIHSEYGMTELLSQAYSKGNGIFSTPPWMKLLVRDATDPLTLAPQGKTGGINVIDLANIYSCSFIATQDLGRNVSENETEVLGRFDNSDIRGCSLMV